MGGNSRVKEMNTTPNDVTLVVWWVVFLPLDPKAAGTNPAKAMDF
jgi:hypothetical protein